MDRIRLTLVIPNHPSIQGLAIKFLNKFRHLSNYSRTSSLSITIQ